MKRKVISSVLCLSLALTAVSCGKVEQEDARRQETEYRTEENEGDADDEPNQPIYNGYWHDEDTTETQQIEGSVEFVFPEGAGSIYELYTIVLNYLNNGFHFEDLANVHDPILTFTFFAKSEYGFADGLSLEESYEQMTRLVSIAEEQGMPLDEDNELDMDLIDIDAFGSDIADMEDPEDFIERLYVVTNSLSQAEAHNPYSTEQTYWEEIPEDLLVVSANGYIGDDVYEIYIGSYDTSNEHMEMYINCFEYNDRYYVLGFSTAVSGVGG
jgi:hypothetical protein